ncbi:MAG: hypothetical protein ACLFVJ_21285, partial [Persicimonas sp.]
MNRRSRLNLLLMVLAAIFMWSTTGCGGCSEDGAGGGTLEGGDASPGESGDTGDAAVELDAVSDASSGGSDATDTRPQPSDADDARDDTGPDYSEECPAYQALCDGECIPASADPDNCGGCGVSCAADQVCSGGRCIEQNECMSNLKACDRRCVDLMNDDDHCDDCGEACPDGEGCVNGECVTRVELGDPPAKCVDGGPPIDIDADPGQPAQCGANVAERTFLWGLCSCDDIDINDGLFVDAYDSNYGPYAPGGLGGGVGINGWLRANNELEVSGTLWVSDVDGIDLGHTSSIDQRLHVGGRVSNNAQVRVGEDAYVNGPFALGDPFDVTGTLHAPDGVTLDPELSYGALQRQPVDVAPPCQRCESDDRIPVGDIVAARADNNDNDLIGLDPDLLADHTEDVVRRLDLPCGHYYLSSINVSGATTIVATGNTALYIGADLKAEEELTITLTPDAQLDVFVAGDVTTDNPSTLGSPNYPALMRVYVGGPNGMTSNNPLRVGANVYAVPGGATNNNPIEVYGSLYTQTLAANNEAFIHYDRRVATVGESCPDPDPDPDPDSDAGYDAGSDGGMDGGMDGG